MRGAFALQRSVWFWLGGFVLGFLVWAWWDSMKTRTSCRQVWSLAQLVSPGRAMHVGLYIDGVWLDSGRVGCKWNHAKVVSPAVWSRFLPFKFVREPIGEYVVMPMVKRERLEPTAGATIVSYRVEVPVWGIVVLYVMVCGGVVVWRGRRWGRAEMEGAEG